MKSNLTKIITLASCAAMITGCAQQQQYGNYSAAPAPTLAATAPTVEKPGKVSAYYPSGKAEGSGLLIEKNAPVQVLAGQPFEYTCKVSNLTDATLENVYVLDRVSTNFSLADSTPRASAVRNGVANWNLGTLGPKESKVITLKGSSADEGVVTTCGWASYMPVACQEIRVVKANIALTKTEPAEELVCDPIPATLMVKNTGSTPLTGVQVADTLPAGMTSNGKSSLTFDAGTLAAGESREFKYNAAASRAGRFVNTAKATTAEGVSAEASATTTVHQPALAITCKAQDQQYMGRRFDVSYTVSSTGDVPAAGSTLEVTIPSGLNCVSTTANGQVSGSKIVWNLGTVNLSAPQNVSATFTSATAGTFQFAGTAKGACAAAVSTGCETKVIGVAAVLLEKSDNPDPVVVGQSTTYTVKVTNQGSANDNNIHVVVTIANELVPLDSSAGTISGQTVDLPVVPTLAPKAAVTYTIVAKGVKVGDGHTSFTLTSDALKSPITAEESTTVY